MTDPSTQPMQATTRRDFVKSSGAAVLGATAAMNWQPLRAAVHVGSSETLKVGLVGCGGRGTGAAAQTLRADSKVKLVAMADVFEDHLSRSHKALSNTDVAKRVQVDPDHRFVGFDGYKKLLETDVDLVLLATPPHFRPEHLRACVEAGKHIFAEKPVGVDAHDIRSVLETTRRAKEKNLMLVSGLCWRYETHMQETIARLHRGAIGDIVALQTTRYGSGAKNPIPRKDGWSDMEFQLRNWYYHTWLSGDFIVEQFVHELDNLAWLMQDEYPVNCLATGGRLTRTGDEYGHIYDHFSAVYEYANGVRLFASTRHQRGCHNENSVHALGTIGQSDLRHYQITGENAWHLEKRRTNMHQLEHNAMYKAFRNGEVINNGEYMAKSTMLGIIARMSAYTGEKLTWEEAMQSEWNLDPKEYSWEIDLPQPQVALPGVTDFV